MANAISIVAKSIYYKNNMKRQNAVRRICKNAIMLTLLCIFGMLAIPFGANVKVSLQLLMVFIICLTAESVIDCLIITSLYLLLGLFLPFYAGFNIGISPTFGFVLSFVVITPVIYFINKIPKLNSTLRMSIACLSGLIICYLIGTVFMKFYLKWDLVSTLMVSVVPYIPFDIAKIIAAISIVILLPKSVKSQTCEKA